MKKTYFFIAALYALSAFIAADAAETELNQTVQSARPNIVFIYTDDHAYQAIGAYGQKFLPAGETPTPQMDRLASQGAIYTNCCVTNSICGPMRAVLQTGKYSHKNGFLSNDGKSFDISQQTFPKLLQKAGYATAIVGKWHLKCSSQPGYDYSETLIDQGPYFNPVMTRNGKQVKHTGYTTEIITDLCLNWLENERDKSKPFMLMCHHKATHRNWIPTPKYYNRFKDKTFPLPDNFFDDYAGRDAAKAADMTIARTMNENDLKLKPVPNYLNAEQKEMWHNMYDSRVEEYKALKARGISEKEMTQWKYQCYMRDYLAVAAAVDDSVGQILDYLDKSGLAENTIVIYSSDQGFYTGEHGWFDKRFMYEESFKTPMIVRWSGVVKPGQKNNVMVSPLDFAETFLDIAQAPIPSDMQGRSLLPIFKNGTTPEDWRKSFYYHYYEYPAEHSVKRHEGVYDGRYKLIHFYNDINKWELFDLESDPTEMNNLIEKEEFQPIIERLKSELENQKRILEVPPRN